jgi:hypothetical protein
MGRWRGCQELYESMTASKCRLNVAVTQGRMQLYDGTECFWAGGSRAHLGQGVRPTATPVVEDAAWMRL